MLILINARAVNGRYLAISTKKLLTFTGGCHADPYDASQVKG